jgi:hypothetical protein
MAFELSFSPDFFIGPYDLDGGDFDQDRPASVWQAIQAMPKDEWDSLCRDLLNEDPEFVTVERVLELIQETNTCRSLSSPVEVYIDPEGYHTVRVYNREV